MPDILFPQWDEYDDAGSDNQEDVLQIDASTCNNHGPA